MSAQLTVANAGKYSDVVAEITDLERKAAALPAWDPVKYAHLKRVRYLQQIRAGMDQSIRSARLNAGGTPEGQANVQTRLNKAVEASAGRSERARKSYEAEKKRSTAYSQWARKRQKEIDAARKAAEQAAREETARRAAAAAEYARQTSGIVGSFEEAKREVARQAATNAGPGNQAGAEAVVRVKELVRKARERPKQNPTPREEKAMPTASAPRPRPKQPPSRPSKKAPAGPGSAGASNCVDVTGAPVAGVRLCGGTSLRIPIPWVKINKRTPVHGAPVPAFIQGNVLHLELPRAIA